MLSDPVIESLIDDYRSRAQRGQEKYGTTLARTDLNFWDWLEHLRQELMDGSAYATRIQQERLREHHQTEKLIADLRLAQERYKGKDLEQEVFRIAMSFYWDANF